jgi:hypothetical protein
LFGELERKRPLGRLRHRSVDYITMGWEDVDWFF